MPTVLKVRRNEIRTTAAGNSRNGGGNASHCRSAPEEAALQETSIQIPIAASVSAVVRAARPVESPARRADSQTPRPRAAISTSGMTTKAAVAGSVSDSRVTRISGLGCWTGVRARP